MKKILQCYHGTSKDSAKKIVSTCVYIESGRNEWLGRGIYFFENDSIQARKFVKAYKKIPDEDIDVLETKLQIAESDTMIDLLTDGDRDFIEQYEKKLQKEITRKLPPKAHYWKHREGYVLDFLFEKNPYVLVRAPYNIPKRKPKEGFCYALIHVQICVKQPSCIVRDTIKIIEE